MNNLKRLREEADISVRDLGTKTNINPGTISRMENGSQQMTDSYAIALADYFRVSIDYLLGRDWTNPEKTVIKTVDFDIPDILQRLNTYSDKQLMKLSGAIEYILENRDNYNPQQIKNTIDKVMKIN